MIQTFEGLSLKKEIQHNLRSLNISTPTAVQSEAIPPLLEGKDVIVQSQTGSGKTLAYALPIIERIDTAEKKLQAIVLVPTRELGAQIARVLEQVTEGLGITSQLLIGGAAIARQIDRLRLHPQIVVGTPGRILELIKVRKLSMHNVRTIIIDEADHIFEQGEGREVETVIRSAMRDRQLCFFSATIPEQVLGLANRWMKEPLRIQIQPEQKTAETLHHQYVLCQDRDRIDTLRRLVRTLNPRSGIIFTNQVDEIGEILAKLKFAGLSVEGLYSEAGKQDRARVMKDFREGRLQLLLATDVAARGLDIPDVTHVIHLDLPVDADHYVHRSGRTGRMGRQGVAIALCAPQQLFILEKFSRALGIDFEQKLLFEGKAVSPGELPKRVLQRKAAEEQGAASASRSFRGGEGGRSGERGRSGEGGRSVEGGRSSGDRSRSVEGGRTGEPRVERGSNGPLVERDRLTGRSGDSARGGQQRASGRGAAGKDKANAGGDNAGIAQSAAGRRVSGKGGAGDERPDSRGSERAGGDPARRGSGIERGRPNPAKSPRQTDKKNKGAPRWLKEKRNSKE
ncbi:MAG: box helicase [Paenibacillaceae bacterium]|jgi:superfamily II DNA/RNA helicase|nr:box helicase [Paenibacillaceae bacterium]